MAPLFCQRYGGRPSAVFAQGAKVRPKAIVADVVGMDDLAAR